MSQQVGKAYNTVQNILNHFVASGFVTEMYPQNKRHKLYKFGPYLEVLEQDYSLEFLSFPSEGP